MECVQYIYIIALSSAEYNNAEENICNVEREMLKNLVESVYSIM